MVLFHGTHCTVSIRLSCQGFVMEQPPGHLFTNYPVDYSISGENKGNSIHFTA